jgi:broad specificity phosphatase PhoE
MDQGLFNFKDFQGPFYFVRHGETDWNYNRLIMGSQDIPLNERGKEQASACAVFVQSLNIETICHSPKKRAMETAMILNHNINKPLVSIEKLQEVCLGSFEGKLKEKGLWDEFMKGGTPPGAESYRQFLERTMEGITVSLINKGPVLIVAHGGTFVAIKDYLNIPDSDERCGNADLFEFYQRNGQWFVENRA